MLIFMLLSCQCLSFKLDSQVSYHTIYVKLRLGKPYTHYISILILIIIVVEFASYQQSWLKQLVQIHFFYFFEFVYLLLLFFILQAFNVVFTRKEGRCLYFEEEEGIIILCGSNHENLSPSPSIFPRARRRTIPNLSGPTFNCRPLHRLSCRRTSLIG